MKTMKNVFITGLILIGIALNASAADADENASKHAKQEIKQQLYAEFAKISVDELNIGGDYNKIHLYLKINQNSVVEEYLVKGQNKDLVKNIEAILASTQLTIDPVLNGLTIHMPVKFELSLDNIFYQSR